MTKKKKCKDLIDPPEIVLNLGYEIHANTLRARGHCMEYLERIDAGEDMLTISASLEEAVERGRGHLNDLLALADQTNMQFVSENQDKKAYMIDFMFLRAAIVGAMHALEEMGLYSLHGARTSVLKFMQSIDLLDDAHKESGIFLTQKFNIRPILTSDWVDEDGNPKGIGGR